MTNLDNEQSLGKSGEQASVTPLIECKYCQEGGHISLFLTPKGLSELESGAVLKTVHPQTGTRFSLVYTPGFHSYRQLEVLPLEDPEINDYDISITDAGFLRLTDLTCDDKPMAEDNYNGIPCSTVKVVIDEEKVKKLATDRTNSLVKDLQPAI